MSYSLEGEQSVLSYPSDCNAPAISKRRNTGKIVAHPWKSARISKRSRCVLANNPSPLTYGGTNTWILSEPGMKDCVVVDPGPDISSHLEGVCRACDEDKLTISGIVLTHDHLDHAEGADHLSSMTGAPIYSRRSGTLPEGAVAFGSSSPCLEVVSLPGHSSDSIGLVFPRDKSVVSGDMLFNQSSTLIYWPEGSLADYLSSLKTLKKVVELHGIKCLLTAHGFPVDNPLKTIDRTYEHRMTRLEKVLCAVEAGAANTVDRLIEVVYCDVGNQFNYAVRLNVHAQLDYLQQKGLLPQTFNVLP